MPLPTPEITEQYDGHSGNLAEDGTRTFRRAFLVNYGNLGGQDADELRGILAHIEVNLPVAFLSSHPAYPFALARTVDIKNAGTPELWMAEIGYSSKPLIETQAVSPTNANPAEPEVNPAAPSAPSTNNVQADQRPAMFRVSNWTEPRILEFDAATGARVVNSADDPFDPPFEVERTNYTFSFTFFRSPANLNWPAREVLMDCVNDRPWKILGRGYPIGTLRCTKVECQYVWDKGPGGALSLFWQIDVELKYKRGGWHARLLDQGRREKIVGATLPDGTRPITRVMMTDQAGQPIADPVPLDGNGRRLATGGTLSYLDFKAYPEQNLWPLFE